MYISIYIQGIGSSIRLKTEILIYTINFRTKCYIVYFCTIESTLNTNLNYVLFFTPKISSSWPLTFKTIQPIAPNLDPHGSYLLSAVYCNNCLGFKVHIHVVENSVFFVYNSIWFIIVNSSPKSKLLIIDFFTKKKLLSKRIFVFYVLIFFNILHFVMLLW